ncbi:MAG: hypothetical protein V7767_02705 [Leeuwenhoekiella sp.]
MKIHYSKKRLRQNLIMGSAWTILTLLKLFFLKELQWTDYGLFSLGLIYFAVYFYELQYQYFTIADGFIYKNSLFSKKIELDKIENIKKYAGDIILMSQDKKLKINPLIITAESKRKLEEQLNITFHSLKYSENAPV